MACTCQPGKGLCRSCLNKEARPYIANPVNGNGEFTRGQIDLFQKQFETTISDDVAKNPLSAMVNTYGSTFYDAVNHINNVFLNRQTTKDLLSNSDEDNLSVISFRTAKGPLTSVEVASFFESSNYTPATAIASSNANGSRFLEELDDYYNGDFSTSVMGGFCSMFNSIFAAINSFFDLLDTIDGIITDVFALIEKIKNIEDPIKALFEKIKVKALIEAIKKKIKKMIEKTITKVCRSISNFDIEAITGPIETPAQKTVAQKAEIKKTALSQVCGPEEAERILNKIEDLIDYGVGLFANPSIEEIMFLISRICGLATGVEGLFKGLKDPLKDFSNRYDEVFNTISNASNRVTGEAIRAGAKRMSESARQSQINNSREQWMQAGNVSPISVNEYKKLPDWETLKSGSDSRLKVSGGWVSNMEPAHEGWTMMNIDVRVLIMRLQKRALKAGIISGPLTLNSGFRSVQYNKKVGGVKSSQHMNGNAADLSWPGINPDSDDYEEFIKLAKDEGFRGIGRYNSFIHVDVGRSREWDER